MLLLLLMLLPMMMMMVIPACQFRRRQEPLSCCCRFAPRPPAFSPCSRVFTCSGFAGFNRRQLCRDGRRSASAFNPYASNVHRRTGFRDLKSATFIWCRERPLHRTQLIRFRYPRAVPACAISFRAKLQLLGSCVVRNSLHFFFDQCVIHPAALGRISSQCCRVDRVYLYGLVYCKALKATSTHILHHQI